MLTLYPFQEESVAKLTGVRNTLLADDMGLGKTVQALEIDRRKRLAADTWEGRKMTLIVCPLSMYGAWQKHLREMRPDLKVATLDSKVRNAFTYAAKNQKADVFICHWEALRLLPELQGVKWFHIIADEVHRAKNRQAQQTQALKKLRTEHKLGLSGTPADNRPDDFWSILNWLYPKTYTSYNRFVDKHVIYKHHSVGVCYVDDCEGYHKRAYKELAGVDCVEELQAAIAPFYVRRLKTEVLQDLPEKYYTQVEVDLTPQQRRAYNGMRDHMLAWVGEQEGEPIAAPVIISWLVRLQQFACAYGELRDIKVKDAEGNWQVGSKLFLTDPSSKLDTIMDIVRDNPDESFVVFAQSKQVINMLGARLQAAGIPVGILTGDTRSSDRTRLVDDFQAGKTRIFCGTIKAGGVGITLTKASTVIFVDRDWSPSINRQAEDRLHRIGQRNAVQVVELVARDTIDAARNQKIELKWSWLKEILGDKK